MNTIFRKFILGALIAALSLAALPLTTAFAAGPTPPAPGATKDPATVNARLELVFAHQQTRITRIGEAVTKFETMTKSTQTLIDKAKANSKDVSAVQTAFDAYKAAFEKGKPLYEQAKTILTAHDGFDASGKVTDAEKAKATIKSLAGILKQYETTVGETFKALGQALKAFRAANPRSTPTPAPSNG